MNFSAINHYLMSIAFTFLLMLMLLSWSQAAFFGFSGDIYQSCKSKICKTSPYKPSVCKAKQIKDGQINIFLERQITQLAPTVPVEDTGVQKLSLQKKYEILTDFVYLLSILSLTVLIAIRWLESGHFPLSNLYESLLFLAWCFLSLKSVFKLESESSFSKLGLSVILSPLALLTFGFAFLSLPKEMQQSTSLVPALQSNWLMMHVTVMVLSYAALISGSLLSIAFLILNRFVSLPTKITNYARTCKDSLLGTNPLSFTQSFPDGTHTLLSTKNDCSTNRRFVMPLPIGHGHDAHHQRFLQNDASFTNDERSTSPSSKVERANNNTADTRDALQAKYNQLDLSSRLDNLSYRILALGFPLLTIGILSGAVWANEAWGSYWSWDPKETWALITWLVFAIYLHTRITKGWSGEKSAIVASVGFCMVWFCYLGVNLLGNGLHSYGWFAN